MRKTTSKHIISNFNSGKKNNQQTHHFELKSGEKNNQQTHHFQARIWWEKQPANTSFQLQFWQEKQPANTLFPTINNYHASNPFVPTTMMWATSPVHSKRQQSSCGQLSHTFQSTTNIMRPTLLQQQPKMQTYNNNQQMQSIPKAKSHNNQLMQIKPNANSQQQPKCKPTTTTSRWIQFLFFRLPQALFPTSQSRTLLHTRPSQNPASILNSQVYKASHIARKHKELT